MRGILLWPQRQASTSAESRGGEVGEKRYEEVHTSSSVSQSKYESVYQMSLKLYDSRLRYGEITIFMAEGRHIDVSKLASCHVTCVCVWFYFLAVISVLIRQFGAKKLFPIQCLPMIFNMLWVIINYCIRWLKFMFLTVFWIFLRIGFVFSLYCGLIGLPC